MTTVLLVRHGETHWNREQRLQGWAPSSLTKSGEQQADILGATIKRQYDVDKIYASDLPRTKQTAEIITRHIPREITYSAGWRERDFGIAQGFTYSEFSRKLPELSLKTAGEDAIANSPESGESLLDTKQRVLDEWHSLLEATDPSNTIVVVTHSGPLNLLLAELDDRSIMASFLDYAQDNCTINEVFVSDTEQTIVKENQQPGDY